MADMNNPNITHHHHYHHHHPPPSSHHPHPHHRQHPHPHHHHPQNAESNIFTHIISHDMESLLLSYATVAMDGLVSYASLRRRWLRFDSSSGSTSTNSTRKNNSSYFSRSGSHSEEKLDEYFQGQRNYHPSLFRYLPNNQHHQNGSQGGGGDASSSASEDYTQSPNDLLRDLDAIIREIRSAREAEGTEDDEEEESDDGTSKRAAKNTEAMDEDNDGKEEEEEDAKHDVHHHQPFKKTKQSPVLSSYMSTTTTANGSEVPNEELERVVREAATVLSNARPPSSFIVYNRDRPLNHTKRRRGEEDSTNATTTTTAATLIPAENEEQQDEAQQQQQQQNQNGPPLFDGSVANATPGHASGGGGGSGTALHLACAIDSPFALAVLLAMGADSSSRHTAFRRLIVHEAACADSPLCLRLLLELGDKFGPDFFPEVTEEDEQVKQLEEVRKQQQQQRSATLPIHNFFSSWGKARSAASTANTTLPHATGRICGGSITSATAPSSSTGLHRQFRAAASVSSLSSSLKDRAVVANSTTTTSTASSGQHQQHQQTKEHTPTPSFVATLRLVLNLTKSIQSGKMDDITAARKLLSSVTLTEPCKIAIASSCYVAPTPGDLDGASSYSATTAAASTSSRGLSARSTSSVSSAASFFSPLPTTVPQPNANADGHGNTPLHWASFKDAADCVSVLLVHRANPSAKAHPSGWTPLHDAAYSDAHRAVSLLLKAGAEVDARANSGATPLCFAAQEDAPGAAELLLEAGADPAVRCCGHSGGNTNAAVAHHHHHHASRFSGYTPLHYCAHYNAARAAHVLLEKSTQAKGLLEVPDLNEKFPIHVAVARGSSDVLRELLHGGARVDTAPSIALEEEGGTESGDGDANDADNLVAPPSPTTNGGMDHIIVATMAGGAASAPMAILNAVPSSPLSQQSPAVVTPVSSPVLRQLIPSRPITSSKPWNCLSQKSIDECRSLISEAEMNWTPERHTLFSPTDRQAVWEVLRVGKRLEQMGTGIFLELWPCVLSFCGRGWFEIEDNSNNATEQDDNDEEDDDDDDSNLKPASSRVGQRDRLASSSLGDDMEFTLFRLDR